MSLNDVDDDCLQHVLSQVDDFRSFYNFCLVCKRFYKVTEWTINWHVNIIKRKIRFYVARFVIHDLLNYEDYWPTITPGITFTDILQWLDISRAIKPTLKNVLQVWESRGPFAAELFLCMRECRVYTPQGIFPIFNSFNSYLDDLPCFCKVLEILFPGEHKAEVIHVMYDKHRDLLCLENVRGSKLNGEAFHSFREYLKNWNNATDDPRSLEKIANWIKTKMGRTNRPISTKFLVKSFFQPRELREICPEVNLDQEEKIFFQDAIRNAKPSDESVQAALKYWKKENGMLMNIVERSDDMKVVRELIKYLPPDVQMDSFPSLRTIEDLKSDFSLETLHELILRTSISPNSTKCEYTDDHVTGKLMTMIVKFSLQLGEIATVKLILKIGRGITLSGSVVIPGQDELLELDVPVTSSFPEIKSALEKLQPFTDLVKECLNEEYVSTEVTYSLSNYQLWRYFCLMASQDTDACGSINFHYRCESAQCYYHLQPTPRKSSILQGYWSK